MAYDIGPKIGMDGEPEFRKQLNNINTELKTLDTELKKVASEFRDNAQSQDALIAKNKTLAKSVEAEKKKIEEAGKALAEAKKNYGENSQEAMKWQQVMNRSETALNNMEAEIRQNDQALEEMGKGLRDAATGAKIMDQAIEKVDDSKLKKLASGADELSSKLSGVSKAAAALGGAVVGSVPATQEFRRDLSFLGQNAKLAGASMKDAENAFKIFNSTSGETDSAIEGVSNLLQAGFTKSNLELAVEGLAGAATRFPDTLKIEGLADGLQETLATGKSVGPFAELLDRLGVGAENFDKELEKCTTSAEKQNLALETLAKAGLMDSYKGWKKGNKELVNYENATLDAQMAISDLATTVAPMVTAVAKGLTRLVKGFNSLPKPVQAAAGGLVSVTAAAAPTISAIGKMSAGMKVLKGNTEKLTAAKAALSKGASGLFGILKAHPYAQLAAGTLAGAAAVAVAIKEVAESLNQETTASQKAAAAREKAISGVRAQNHETDIYFQKLQELNGVENKTMSQKQLMQSYVDKLNESVEGLNLTYDEENDKLSQSVSAIEKKIEAQKQEAMQAAYLKQSKKAMEDLVETEIKLADKQAERAQKEKEYEAIFEKGSSITYEEAQRKAKLGEEIKALSGDIDDLTNAQSNYNQEYVRLSNLAAMQGEAWKTLAADAKTAGYTIPENLITGIQEGTYAIPTTMDELTALIDFQNAADKAGAGGRTLVNSLTAEIAAGNISVTDATKELTDANAAQLDKGAQAASGKGKQTGKNYAGGVESTKQESKTAGTDLTTEARTGAGSVSLRPTGKNLGIGFSKGLRDSIVDVARAARDIAEAALENAKKQSKVNSPSKRWERELGMMDGAGLAKGLRKSIPEVRKAGMALSDAAFPGYSGVAVSSAAEGVERVAAVAGASFTANFDYKKLAAMMPQGIMLEGRQMGRAMRAAGVKIT